MVIKEPTVTYVPQLNTEEHIAFCASTCYNSTPKKDIEASKFVQGLVKSKHLSVLRHASYYFICPNNSEIYSILELCFGSPYIDTELYDGMWYVATNGQFIQENNAFLITLDEYKVTPEEFNKTPIGHSMMRYTFVLETQISTSRELARHSPQNFTEASTRYIKGQEAIVRPHWITSQEAHAWEKEHFTYGASVPAKYYLESCRLLFNDYATLLGQGVKPEDARGVLPLDTYTKVVMTHSIKEWQKIIDMRVNGSTGKPHPNIKYLISMVKDELNKLGYDIK